jgi:hypothetical protein
MTSRPRGRAGIAMQPRSKPRATTDADQSGIRQGVRVRPGEADRAAPARHGIAGTRRWPQSQLTAPPRLRHRTPRVLRTTSSYQRSPGADTTSAGVDQCRSGRETSQTSAQGAAARNIAGQRRHSACSHLANTGAPIRPGTAGLHRSWLVDARDYRLK